MTRRLQKYVAGSNRLLGFSAISEMASSLARTFVLARMLPPEQFGVAVTLVLTLSLVEILGDVGLERSIVRLRQDVTLSEQRDTLHTLAVVRGAILAIGLAIAAPFLASAFKTPESVNAFMALGACPLIRGFAHLGSKEQSRQYIYGSDAFSTIVLHVSSMLATVACAFILQTYWAASAGLIVGLLVYSATTHMLDSNPWRLRWRSETARDALRYGAPLIPNGLSQGLKALGDRLVVGALMGPAALAFYNVTMMVGILPRTISLRYLTTIFLPRFVNAEGGRQANPLVSAFAVLVGGLSLTFGLGLWSIGGPAIGMVFGSNYLPSQTLVGTTAALVAVRMLYAVVTLPAMAFGGTAYILVGSAGSLAGVAIGATTLWLTRDLAAFVTAMLLVEFCALIIAIRVARVPLRLDSLAIMPAVIVPPSTLLGLAGVELAFGPIGWFWRCAVAVGIIAFFIASAPLLLGLAGSSASALAKALRDKPSAPSQIIPSHVE